MKTRLLLIFMTYLIATACQDIPSVERPQNFIPENQMEEMLYESVLLKSSRGYNIGQVTSKGINPEKYVLEKFDIDSTQYAENIAYYASQLELYTAMNTRIKDRIAAILKVEDSLAKQEKKISDSIRLKRARENEIERVARMKKDSAAGNTGKAPLKITPEARLKEQNDSL